jgi:hypothetical protein
MKAVVFMALLAVSAFAYAHVHQWVLVDSFENEQGIKTCQWMCDYSGQKYFIETTNCWNPND